jgi:hypothetical protein
MDMVNIVKTIRDADIIIQHMCKDPYIFSKVLNNSHKIIELDSENEN